MKIYQYNKQFELMDYIIAKRYDCQVPKYFVKWNGKQHKQNTWLTAQQLNQTEKGPQLMRQFEANQKKNLADSITVKSKKSKKIRNVGKKQKRTIMLKKLKITLPCISKQRTDWIFGHRVKQIISKKRQGMKYEVKWMNGGKSIQKEQDLIQKQSELMCLFFERELKLKI